MLRPARKSSRVGLVYLFALGAVALARGPASAAVVEPNGTMVPAPAPANETTLQAYFTAQQENINALTDAAIEPGAFLPLCDFKATLVLSQSNADAGFAWYNTTTGATGVPTVYQIGGFPLMVGQTIASSDVRNDARYAGGLIGLVLLKNFSNMTPPVLSNVYYSEYNRNANCTACTMPGRWKMALAYRSTRYPNSYYLAFEDWEGADMSSWQGNDGDFNDKVFRVDGVICEGGGEPCDTKMPGVCVQGVTECQVGAGIICKPAVGMKPEKCDNLDNDCNGMVDDGTALCPNAFVCSKGVCIRPCDDSEFPCAVGLQCDTDGLARPALRDDRLPGRAGLPGRHLRGRLPGRRLSAGPGLPARRLRRSVRGGVMPAVCEKGACVSGCRCRACPTGQVCAMGGALDGHCVDTGCDTMTCPAGTICRRGTCEDACQAATICPGGAACREGKCDDAPPAMPTGTGGTSGSSGAGGFVITGNGGTTGTGGSAAAGAAGAVARPARARSTQGPARMRASGAAARSGAGAR